MAESDISPARLRDLYFYDPLTGSLVNRIHRPRACRGSSAVKMRPDLYCYVIIDRRNRLAHRVAWAIVMGEWPQGVIDHIDGDPSNNRWSNLRCVSMRANMENRRSAMVTNRIGILGVSSYLKASTYRARIQVNGKEIYIGSYKTADAAHDAYIAAKRRLHPGCTI